MVSSKKLKYRQNAKARTLARKQDRRLQKQKLQDWSNNAFIQVTHMYKTLEEVV